MGTGAHAGSSALQDRCLQDRTTFQYLRKCLVKAKRISWTSFTRTRSSQVRLPLHVTRDFGHVTCSFDGCVKQDPNKRSSRASERGMDDLLSWPAGKVAQCTRKSKFNPSTRIIGVSFVKCPIELQLCRSVAFGSGPSCWHHEESSQSQCRNSMNVESVRVNPGRAEITFKRLLSLERKGEGGL